MTHLRCACGEIIQPAARVCAACATDLEPRPSDDTQPSVASGSHGGWYYLMNGRMVGPCDSDELRRLLRVGELSEDFQVWSPGMVEWTPVLQIELGAAAAPVREDRGPAWMAGSERPTVSSPLESTPGSDRHLQRAVRVAAGRAALPEAGAGGPADGDTAEAVSAAIAPAFTDFSDTSAGPDGGSEPRPWRRWFARLLDTTLAALALGILIGIAAPDSEFFENNVGATLIVLAAWLLVETFLLAMFGTTPGKALMNIRLSHVDGHTLTLQQAFGRSCRVWFFGMGAGLPIANLVMMVLAYRRLMRDGATSWDRGAGLVITHGQLGAGRVAAITLFAIAYIALVASSAMSG
jgi:uncharacterized RDD family membrane protein YckC